MSRSAEIVLVPQPHGGAIRRGGPGRKPTRAEIARREAGEDLLGYVRKLRDIRDDPDVSAEDLCKAAVACLRISGVDRQAPPQTKRTHFGVARAPAAELATHLEPARPERQKRSEGPQDPEGLGGTRVASLPNDSVPNESLVSSEEPRGTS